jgi:hypothetical protein
MRASLTDINNSMFKNSSLVLLLNDSTNGFSQRAAGEMDSVSVPLPTHHSSRARAMNSGPLSMRIWVSWKLAQEALQGVDDIDCLLSSDHTNCQGNAPIVINDVEELEFSAVHDLVKLKDDCPDVVLVLGP